MLRSISGALFATLVCATSASAATFISSIAVQTPGLADAEEFTSDTGTPVSASRTTDIGGVSASASAAGGVLRVGAVAASAECELPSCGGGEYTAQASARLTDEIYVSDRVVKASIPVNVSGNLLLGTNPGKIGGREGEARLIASVLAGSTLGGDSRDLFSTVRVRTDLAPDEDEGMTPFATAAFSLTSRVTNNDGDVLSSTGSTFVLERDEDDVGKRDEERTFSVSFDVADGIIFVDAGLSVFTKCSGGLACSATADAMRSLTFAPILLFDADGNVVDDGFAGSASGFDYAAGFSSGDPLAPVPLPASGVLILAGIGMLRLLKTRRLL